MKSTIMAVLAALVLVGTAAAEPTEIAVRVISRDAKFIGTSMGGVQVTLRDADTGELLAQGLTAGATGDTKRIMERPRERGAELADKEAAAWRTTLDLDRPRRIELTARGPMAQRQALNTVSATQWIVPGRDLTGGDGWVIEMPGLVVDVLAPATHVKLAGVPRTVTLEANVTMMCGCPIEPDGTWDAAGIEVAAILARNGEVIREVPLSYAGETSRFSGKLEIAEPGAWEATVYAFQPATGNTGLDHATFVVSRD